MSTSGWDVGHKGRSTLVGAILCFALVSSCRMISGCDHFKGNVETFLCMVLFGQCDLGRELVWE